jgi:hypothetical protein
MMLMNWDDMRIFLSVARAGTLSGAARELRITQPTVGRRLKGLEEALGTRLFDRLPEGFAPTLAGEELLPLAEAMEASALTVNRRQPALMESARGTVRISVWENLAKLLTDHIADLRRNLPEIEIEISVTHIHAIPTIPLSSPSFSSPIPLRSTARNGTCRPTRPRSERRAIVPVSGSALMRTTLIFIISPGFWSA